ncbi:MAG: hypothetical protein JWR33_1603 [Naasia sp.]|jgi:hypothetical protein|uniref:hypothetical protein n=1 Tax=Naasia sp. TaxID=2546198 RepID=UPI00262BAFAB|nr:hypothetical protein [Naasia sp.]MCU1570862.1 hypothetical protein [Naasia sp.]
MPSPSRSFRRGALALLVALALAPSLAACGGNPIESLIEKATGGNVDLGGGSVPKGFPSEVPLYDGEVVYGIAVGDAAGKAFNVTVRVPDAQAGEDIRSQLEDAGFELLGGSDATAAGGAAFASDSYGVVVVLTEDGSHGWVANYTVTPNESSGS